MSARRPFPDEAPQSQGGPFQAEHTVAESGSGPGVPHGAPVYVLERGTDSRGSEAITFLHGEQRGPVTIGRAGDFRLDGPGVLAAHGYLMFDGDGLYVCSADEANPLTADGARIPRSWTRVEIPCLLLFGRTRAMLRGAIAPEAEEPARESPTRVPTGYSNDDATDPRGVPVARNPYPSGSDASTPIEGVAAAAPARPARDRTDRARPRITAPGDDESTRVEADALARPPLRVASGDDESTRVTTDPGRGSSPALDGMGRVGPSASAMAAYPTTTVGQYARPPAEPLLAPPPPRAPAPPPPGYAAMPPGYAPGPPGYAPPPPGASSFGQSSQPGFAPVPPPTATPVGPLQAHGAAARPPRPPRTLPPFIEKAVSFFREGLAADSPRRKPILAVTCFSVAVFVVTIVTLLRLHAASSAMAAGGGAPSTAPARSQADVATSAAAAPTAVTAGVVVYPSPAPKPDLDAGTEPTPHPRKGKNAEPPPPPTLERTAVDAMNRGDLTTALGVYRKLAQRDPDNVAFANAVRVLSQRVGGGGAPP